MTDPNENGYSKTVTEAVRRMSIGSHISSGCTRDVYQALLFPQCVLKLEDRAVTFHNILEWEFWNAVKHTKWKKWFAPCHHISPDGSVLMMAKTTPLHGKLPAKLPAIFTDTKRENFGMFEGRMVCHDYAFSMTILSSRSLTDRLVKVKWHSEGS